jgi:hypothetical protein
MQDSSPVTKRWAADLLELANDGVLSGFILITVSTDASSCGVKHPSDLLVAQADGIPDPAFGKFHSYQGKVSPQSACLFSTAGY